MRRPLRIALWTVGGLAAAVAAGLAVFAATFDANAYKPTLVSFVEAKYGRKLAIAGDIGLAFFPKLGVRLGPTTLSATDGAGVFARFEEARVALALWPLLRRQVVVDRVVLRGFAADLVRHRDGSTNFDDLLGRRERAEPPPASPSTGADAPAGRPAVALDVGGITLADASIGWRDEAAGTDVRVTGLGLETDRIAEGVPGALRLSAVVTGKAPAIQAKVTGRAGYSLAPAQGAYTLDGMDFSIEGDVAGIQGLVATLRGAIAVNAAGRRLEVAGLRIAAKSADGLEASLDAPKLVIAPGAARGERVEATARLVRAGRTVDAKFALAGLAAEGDVIRFPQFALDVALKQSARELRVELTGRVEADLAKEVVSTSVLGRIDGAKVTLDAGMTGFAKPAFTFALDAERLDVDALRGASTAPASPPASPPAAGSGTVGSTGPTPQAKRADAPIDLSPLRPLVAKGQVRVGSLTAAGLRMRRFDATIRAVGGRLAVEPLAADLYDGSVRGSVTVDANDASFTVRQTLSDVRIGPLLVDLAGRDVMEGRGTVNLDLRTRGATVDALRRALEGKAALALRDGAIKGFNVGEIARKVQALTRGGTEQYAAVRAEKTDFAEMTMTFVVRNGVAFSDDLAAKSPLMRLAGAGRIDVGGGTIDYTARATVAATSKGQGGRAADDVRGVTVPVRLTGPFDQIAYTVDYSAAASYLLRDEAARRVQDALKSRVDEQTRGRIGDALKGLLGR